MYTHAVLGGTFDHLHAGHRTFLTHAFSIAPRVTIGLTTDAYVQTHKKTMPVDEEAISGVCCPCISQHVRQSYEERKRVLTTWLDAQGCTSRYTIVALDDVVGPAGTMQADVLVVSEETREGARVVNAERKRHGLPELAISVVALETSEDRLPISSTRIRNKIIDCEGNLILPAHLRQDLAKPIGEVVSDTKFLAYMNTDRSNMVITVGDKTTDRLLEQGVMVHLAVIDFFVERKPYTREKADWDKLPRPHVAVQSGPGYISGEAMDAISRWAASKQPMTLIVDGEEDLLVLPIIVSAPIDAVVYYGQPNVGLVRIVVTSEQKHQAQLLLTQFVQPQ